MNYRKNAYNLLNKIKMFQVFVCVATDTLLNEDVVGYIYFGGIEWEGTVEVRACSDKISHEERIVSGVLSRPQSPILSDDVNDQDAQNEK